MLINLTYNRLYLIICQIVRHMAIGISSVIWLVSIISLSIGGTFTIFYIIRHMTDYFEKRKNG